MKKQTNTPVMDERQLEITGKALNIAGGFLALCMVVAVIIDIVTTGEAGWELFALIGSCLVFLIASRKLGDIQPPKNWYGKFLPTGNSQKDRSIRKKSYLISSIVFAGTFALMDILLILFGEEHLTDLEFMQQWFSSLGKLPLTLITAGITFLMIFAVSYPTEYLYHEKYELAKYHKMISALDTEEDDPE